MGCITPQQLREIIRIANSSFNTDNGKVNDIIYIRAFIPIAVGFEKLCVNQFSNHANIYYWQTQNKNIASLYPKMVSPYYNGEVALTEQLYDWVYESRYDAATTREEIVAAYARFVQ